MQTPRRPPALLAVSTLSALAALSFPAAAYQPLITDDTGTQGTGGNQIEISYNQDREESSGLHKRTRTLPFVFTRGLTDSLDVFVQANRTRIRSDDPADPSFPSTSGAGNASIGAKWRFYENETSKTSIAIKPELVLPVGSGKENRGMGTGRTSLGLTAILTQEMPFGAIHANIGAGRDRFRDTTVNPDATTTHVSVAPVWDVTEQWKLALDVGTDRERAGGTTTRTSTVELGTVYSANKDLDFALGFIRSKDNASPETTLRGVTAGVTWRFK
jgi:hypothetical protein